MKYYLGIDGGGTKTTALLTDENGKILIKVQGKTINFYAVGMEKARENLKSAITEISEKTGVKDFDGVFIGCSALDGEAEGKTVKRLCDGVIKAEKIEMNSDTYIALKGMGEVNCPVVVICGTGSMVIGEKETGELLVSGGWGHILGDEGSGYAIAVSALKECAILNDKGEKADLLKKACQYFNIENFRDIIPVIYASEMSKDKIAGFGAVVGELSQKGDKISTAIIEDEVKKLYKTAEILIKKLKNTAKIGLYGGVFEKNQLFRDIFKAELKKDFPHISAELLTVTPEETAARLAREL